MTGHMILIVDDEKDFLYSLAYVLQGSGYQVLTCRSAGEALAKIAEQRVDLIISDIVMPQVNGYQFFQEVGRRAETAAIPFIFLTARIMDSDLLYGLELGVDDYLTKPFNRQRLLATVRGKLKQAERRRQAEQSAAGSAGGRGEPFLKLGELEIDPLRRRVWLQGEFLSLSAREYAVLEALTREGSDVVPFEEMVQASHGFAVDRREASDLLRPLVRSIRRKMGYEAGEVTCIETVRGIGYRLVPPAPRQND